MAKKILMGVIVWNYWQIAARCVKSIREHTDLADVRLVLFDNGSDDVETQKWLDTCGEEVYHIGKNTGCCGALRKMFEFSYTLNDIEFVCPMCPDVLFTDTWLDRLIDVMKLEPNAIVIAPKDNNGYHCWQCFPVPGMFQPETMHLNEDFSVKVFVDDDSKLQEYIKREFYAKRKHPTFVETNGVDMPVSLWRKSLMKEVGNFNMEFDWALGDIEMFIRVCLKGYKIIYCLSSFIYHYAHGASGLYDGYMKKFNEGLGEYARRKAQLIKHIYGVDISDYGRGSVEVFRKEVDMVRL